MTSATNTKQMESKAIWAMGLMAAVLMAQAGMAAAQQPGSQQPATAMTTTTETNPAQREIVVSLEDHKLALVENGQVVKIYPVAVGKLATPSPVGTFTISRRVANPTYHHDGKTIAPGPGNPVGTRWMGLSIKGYGIHGTNEPKSIGKAASHGCIRMAKADLEELYPQVTVGETVELVGHRDEETARLFGSGVKPAATTEPVMAQKTTPAPATQPVQAAQPAAATTNVPAMTAAAILTGAL